MPEDTKVEEERTVPEADYKKLQRKLNKVNTKVREMETQIADLSTAAPRVESMLEGLATLLGGDEQLKPSADALIKRNVDQRGTDSSATQSSARLEQIIEDADEEWLDTKFDPARQVLEEINKSGDQNRVHEVERLIREAISPEAGDVSAQIEAAVSKALLEDKQGRTRVDNERSLATEGVKVRYSDLASLNPKEGVTAMKEKVKQALDQMGI